MRQYVREVDASFTAFSAQWPQDAAASKATLDGHDAKFLASYRHLVSLQAWRELLLASELTAESLQFFLEAQNDSLVSHVAARYGMWRPALQGLRSCLENVLACLYYKDHAVELALWQQGKHRLGFAELHGYFVNHPNLSGLALSDCGLDSMKEEYATLSKAVHGSAAVFRMTEGATQPTLWIADAARLGKWATREGGVLRAVNLLMVALYRANLSGAQRRGLREAVSLAIPRSAHPRVLQTLGVRLLAP